MGYRLTVFKCPNCMANLEVGEDRFVVCPYCESTVRIEEHDDSAPARARAHGGADLRRKELEQERRRRERAERELLERQMREEHDRDLGLVMPTEDERRYAKGWRKGIVIWLVVIFLFLTLSSAIPALSAPAGGAFIAAPITLFILRPSRYVPGDYARRWRRALIGYFVGMMVFMCFDSDFLSVIAGLWIIIGPIALFVTRPSKMMRG